MALLETPEANKGFQIPDFSLKGTDGQTYTYDAVKGEKGLVVICNHCPYVVAVIDRLVEDIKSLQAKRFGAIAVMSNDTVNYPADSFDNMKVFAEENGFSFPYVIDETQDIAKAFGAICTPDIYGFNAGGELQYRGRVDSAGKNAANDTTEKELVNAMLAIAETGQGPEKQFPSMGCSIKWKNAA